MTEQIVFETTRLTCRRWTERDVDAIYAVYSDEEGARWVDDGQPIEYSECERWIEVTLNNYTTRGYGMFALDDKATGQTIGFCGLVHPGGQEVAEIKYAFLKTHWGQGLASEVVPAMIAWGQTDQQLTRIIATVASENLASQRVLLKSGLQFCGTEEEDDSVTYVYEWMADQT